MAHHFKHFSNLDGAGVTATSLLRSLFLNLLLHIYHLRDYNNSPGTCVIGGGKCFSHANRVEISSAFMDTPVRFLITVNESDDEKEQCK